MFGGNQAHERADRVAGEPVPVADLDGQCDPVSVPTPRRHPSRRTSGVNSLSAAIFSIATSTIPWVTQSGWLIIIVHPHAFLSRDNDTAARLGGEEFGLLLAGVDLQRAVAAADRLRAVLGGKRVEGIGTVTVSIGVAGCPESATSERALYSASDEALYVSKNAGRDRVSVAPPLQEKLPGV